MLDQFRKKPVLRRAEGDVLAPVEEPVEERPFRAVKRDVLENAL